MFHNLKAQGLSISEIARHQNCGRKTVRKHLHASCPDAEALRRKAGPGKLDIRTSPAWKIASGPRNRP